MGVGQEFQAEDEAAGASDPHCGAGAGLRSGVRMPVVQRVAVRERDPRVRPVLQLPHHAVLDGEGLLRVLELVRLRELVPAGPHCGRDVVPGAHGHGRAHLLDAAVLQPRGAHQGCVRAHGAFLRVQHRHGGVLLWHRASGSGDGARGCHIAGHLPWLHFALRGGIV